MTNTPQQRCENFNTNYELLAQIKEAKSYQPIPAMRPTMTYRVDARNATFPKWKKLKLNKSKFATEN